MNPFEKLIGKIKKRIIPDDQWRIILKKIYENIIEEEKKEV